MIFGLANKFDGIERRKGEKEPAVSETASCHWVNVRQCYVQ